MHCLDEPSREAFEAEVLSDPPDLIAYSATTNLFRFVQTWSRWCRERLPDVPQICGGVHVTLNSDAGLTTTELDAVCMGEGEWPMVELCDHLQRGKMPYRSVSNLAFKDRHGALHRNPPRPLMSGRQLDDLPFADRFLFDPNKICEPARPIVMASRGCPYDCTYCCNRALRKVLGKGAAVRIRGVESVISEIKCLRRLFPYVSGIHFDDDIFGIKLDWLREFTAAYRREIGLPFSCNLRPDLARDEVVRLLAKGGADEVALGVETGNADLRRRLLGREIDNRLLLDVFRRLEEAGIRAHAFNMVGVPHEKMENSLETIKLNAVLKKKWRMPELRITIFHPYVGTELYEEAYRHNLLTDRRVTDYADDTVLNLDSMSRHQIRFVARYFRLLVVVYQRLLHDLGRTGLLGAGMLDRLLLSRLARQWIFPVANEAFPWCVKLLRLLKMHGNPPPTRPVTAPDRPPRPSVRSKNGTSLRMSPT